MPTHEHTSRTASSLHAGTLLFVTNPVNDGLPALEFACALADRHHAHLELVHVVDSDPISSVAEAQKDIQYHLQALARNLRSIRRNAEAILLFGKPEHVLRERAENTKALLIAIALNGSATDRVQKKLAECLARSCDCPVLTVPPDIGAGDLQALSVPNHPARKLA
jgi:nucleotide-binding universal stress UspA family protein